MRRGGREPAPRGERVLLDVRPHPKALVLPVLALLLVAGAGGFAAARAGGQADGPLRLAVAVAALLLLLRLSLLPYLRWRGTRLVLTDERLSLTDGVLRRSGRDVPLARVDEVLVARSLRQRLQGCGDLQVTAGDAAPLVVRDLRDVAAVQRAVHRALERAGERAWPGGGQRGAPGP